MNILDRNVQLIPKESKKSYTCFICNKDKSVKYSINIGNYEVCFCSKCTAKYSDDNDKTVFKAAMKSSDSYFDGDKFIQKLDIKEEYDTIKESSYRISHLANEILYAFCSKNISKEKIDKINKEYNNILNDYFDREYQNGEENTMKILGKEAQLMSDEKRKNTYQCFICGDTSESVKYTIDIGKYTLPLCNKCLALHHNDDIDTIIDTAVKTSINIAYAMNFTPMHGIIPDNAKENFEKDKKYIIEAGERVKQEYAMTKEMNRDLKPAHDNTIDKAIKNDHRALNEYLDEKYSNDRDERFLKFLKENSAYKNPDDDIRIYPLPNRTDNRPCSACGSTVSVKYFFMDKKDKSHLLCNRCAYTRDFSCAYENSGAKTQEEFEKVQKEIDEFSNKPEMVDFDFKSMYPSELKFNEEDHIGSDTTEKTIGEEAKENKFVYLFCRKDCDINMNLDTVEDLVDNFVKDVELSFENIELYIIDVYENRDTAYKAMCLDHRSLTASIDHYISGTKSQDNEFNTYDIKYVYNIDHGYITIYIVYKKEVI